MEINKFRELEKKINNQNFNQGYRNINMVMFILSIFGHITSIFLAYFALSKVLMGVIENNTAVVIIASIIMLVGLELLKRDIFDKFSIQYLKAKSFTKDVIPLMLLSIALITVSFYASIHGAKEFSSKDDLIEKDRKETIVLYKDSLEKSYKLEVDSIRSIITKNEESISELTNLNVTGTRLTSGQNKALRMLENKNKEYTKEIKTLESEKAKKILDKDKEVSIESSSKKEDNSSNSLAFILISTLIEFIILAGVYFNEYYKFRSYREFRDKISKDTSYQKWMLYDQILNIIYQEDAKMNQKLPSKKAMIDACRVNDIILMPKDIVDFLKVMNGLDIIKTNGSIRYINKRRDLSFEILRKNFNIE